MSFLRPGLIFLSSAFLMAGCAGAPDEAGVASPGAPAAQGESVPSFMAAQDKRKAAKDFAAMFQAGQAFAKTHPTETDAFWTAAYGAYMSGDLDSAISLWNKCLELAPERRETFQTSIDTALRIQKQWPDLQLKAPVWVESDADIEQEKWKNQASKLLDAKKYDEIEAIAAKLQASGARTADGTWALDAFARGTWVFTDDTRAEANWAARKKQIEAWRAARPKSLLARVALMAQCTNGAWLARGEEYADKISDAQFKIVNARLAQAAKIAPTLLPDIQKSPLVAARLQKWALLAGMPAEQYWKLVTPATKKWPSFTGYDIDAAQFLMPRWFGERGDWEDYAAQRADELGGEAGDVLYARIVHSQYLFTPRLRVESSASYPRAKRGFEALLKRNPNSISNATAFYQIATSYNDQATAQRVLIEHVGHRAQEGRWKTLGGFGENRMKVLSAVGQTPYSRP